MSAGGSCDDFAVVGGNMDSDLEQPVSTSVLNVTVTEADIGTLRFCCQANISNPAVSGNDVTFITVVGESACVYTAKNNVLARHAFAC